MFIIREQKTEWQENEKITGFMVNKASRDEWVNRASQVIDVSVYTSVIYET